MVIKPNRWLEIRPSAVEVGGFSLHPHMHLTNQTTFGASFYSNASDFSQFKCDTSCLWSMLGGLSGSAAGYKGGEKGGGGGLTCNDTGDFSHEAFHGPDGDTFGLILDESNNLLNLQKRTRKKGQFKQSERHRSRRPRSAGSADF